MTIRTHYLAAAAAIAAIAAPAAAQTAYPYGYQQSYPQYQQPYSPYQQAYPQQYGQQPYTGYGYSQNYATQNPVQQIIDSLLGNRYAASDRTAVSQCATRALTQAQAQYGAYNSRYGQSYGQVYGSLAYGYANTMRVTAITDVQRRSGGLRVKGTIASGAGYNGQYGQYAYNNQRYAPTSLSFRCNVAYNGAVTDVRIGRRDGYRGY